MPALFSFGVESTGFEEEVIDRLHVLNAERAAEEKRLGLGLGKKGLTAVVHRAGARPALHAANSPRVALSCLPTAYGAPLSWGACRHSVCI